jgi:hypothetical protein
MEHTICLHILKIGVGKDPKDGFYDKEGDPPPPS